MASRGILVKYELELLGSINKGEMRGEGSLDCKELGPLGLEAPLGESQLLGNSLLPIVWARHSW